MMETTDEELMITTIDNPYNPKTEYDKWRQYDMDNGHNTEEFIARLVDMEDDFDVDDELKVNELTNKVIQDIINLDVIGTYTLV